MTEEQASAWLALEGWRPVGVCAPSHWFGVIRPDGVLVSKWYGGKGYDIHHEKHDGWYTGAVSREWGHDLQFLKYIQSRSL